MDKLIELNAMLRLYESNYRNLHWNSKGIDFNDSHKSITTDYYEMISESIDEVAEFISRLGGNAPNYMEVCEILNSQERRYLIVNSSELYSREQIVQLSDTMLNDICTLISECLEDSVMQETINAGIKSDLESMLSKYDLQARYINKRRL